MISTARRVRHLPRYRRIVTVLARHGFGSILEILQIHRRLSLPQRLLKQKAPDQIRPAAHLRLALEELGPTFVKLGQILSTRPDLLPPEYIHELSKLQDTVPPVPWEEVRALIQEELEQPPEQVFAHLDPTPMAAASLAQVHPAVLPDGSEVVIKVQRPHIQETINDDLEILADMALLAKNTALNDLVDPIAVVEDFAFILRNELDYRREGRNADRFRESFASEPTLYIPTVYWQFTTNRVLVLERLHGIKINNIAAIDEADYDRHRIALHSARIIVKEVLEDGFFHADPHPGNFVVMPDEVIGAMDFGMVGYLRKRDRLNLIRLYSVSVMLDADGVVDQLTRMGAAETDVDKPGLARAISRLLGKYNGMPLKDIRAGEVVEEIMPIAYRFHLSLPSDLWLLGKTLAMLEGTGLQLDPDFDIFTISEPFIKRLLAQQFIPDHSWGQTVLGTTTSWLDFMTNLPITGNRLLQKAEEGSLFQLHLRDEDHILDRLDRMLTRVALSILIAGLIIGVGLLIPAIPTNDLVHWLVVIGFALAAGLGLWFVALMLRGKR